MRGEPSAVVSRCVWFGVWGAALGNARKVLTPLSPKGAIPSESPHQTVQPTSRAPVQKKSRTVPPTLFSHSADRVGMVLSGQARASPDNGFTTRSLYSARLWIYNPQPRKCTGHDLQPCAKDLQPNANQKREANGRSTSSPLYQLWKNSPAAIHRHALRIGIPGIFSNTPEPHIDCILLHFCPPTFSRV